MRSRRHRRAGARCRRVGRAADAARDGRPVVLDATWPARSRAARAGAMRSVAAGAARRGPRRAGAAHRSSSCTDRAVGSRPGGRSRPCSAVGRVQRRAASPPGCVRAPIIAVECGDCFDVHDVAMLVAAGASAVHPWLLLELAAEHAGARGSEELTAEEARANTIAALEAGLRKVLARMGISTLASYRGGQLFDAVGLDPELVATLLPGGGRVARARSGADADRAVGAGRPSPSRVGRRAAGARGPRPRPLPRSGEVHAFAPRVVKATQALAAPDADADATLAAYRAGGRRRRRRASRATCWRCGPLGPPVPLEEVEPASRDRPALRQLGDEPRGAVARGAPGDQHRHGAARRRRRTPARAARIRRGTRRRRTATGATPRSSRSRRRASG